jgi:hypothetical protein
MLIGWNVLRWRDAPASHGLSKVNVEVEEKDHPWSRSVRVSPRETPFFLLGASL